MLKFTIITVLSSALSLVHAAPQAGTCLGGMCPGQGSRPDSQIIRDYVLNVDSQPGDAGHVQTIPDRGGKTVTLVKFILPSWLQSSRKCTFDFSPLASTDKLSGNGELEFLGTIINKVDESTFTTWPPESSFDTFFGVFTVNQTRNASYSDPSALGNGFPCPANLSAVIGKISVATGANSDVSWDSAWPTISGPIIRWW